MQEVVKRWVSYGHAWQVASTQFSGNTKAWRWCKFGRGTSLLYYILQIDSKANLSAQVIKPSRISNLSTVIFRRKVTLMQTMQSLLGNTQALVQICDVRFADLCIMDIVNEVASSIVLATSSRATFLCYFRVGVGLMIRHKVEVPLTFEVS